MKRYTLHRKRRGLSLIEVVLASLLVGVVLVGALRCAGSVIAGRTNTALEAQATHLAEDLLVECQKHMYVDDTNPIFGPEAIEVTGYRDQFDDVDDFDGWTTSPPEFVDGTVHSKLVGWNRSVEVVWVDPADPTATSLSDLGMKRITVTVSRNGQVLAKSVGLRSRWND